MDEPRAEHDYFDVMMGSLRYIKHRRRGENWQAYKCYRGFIEQLANAHAASNSPHSIYKELDIQGNDEILKLFLRATSTKKSENTTNLSKTAPKTSSFCRGLAGTYRKFGKTI